jgi:L-threonate 2-dehydrogenase
MNRKIAVIGLGSMGMGVAQSLVRAGFVTLGFDLRKAACEAFAANGGIAIDSFAAIDHNIDVVIVLVLNAAQAEDALFGENALMSRLRAGSAVFLSTTVAPDDARRISARLAERGIDMLDAPVSGGAIAAAQGSMVMMVSGADTVIDRHEAIFNAIAKKVYRIGTEPGAGSSMKMINQLLAGVHIAAACEAMALAKRAGLPLEQVYEVICASAGGSWMFQNRMPHILADDYTAKSAIVIWPKDLGIVCETAKQLSFPLPLTSAALQQYMAAMGHGLAAEDDAALFKLYPQQTAP